MHVMIEGILYTHQRYKKVPQSYRKIPVGALSAATYLIEEERKEVYNAQGDL